MDELNSQIRRDREWNSGFQGRGGKGDGELAFSGHRVSVWGDGEVPEMNGDGRTAVCMCSMSLLSHIFCILSRFILILF